MAEASFLQPKDGTNFKSIFFPTQVLTCPEHDQEKLQFYCRSCQRLLCPLCKLRRLHSGHKILPVAHAYQALKVRDPLRPHHHLLQTSFQKNSYKYNTKKKSKRQTKNKHKTTLCYRLLWSAKERKGQFQIGYTEEHLNLIYLRTETGLKSMKKKPLFTLCVCVCVCLLDRRRLVRR